MKSPFTQISLKFHIYVKTIYHKPVLLHIISKKSAPYIILTYLFIIIVVSLIGCDSNSAQSSKKEHSDIKPQIQKKEQYILGSSTFEWGKEYSLNETTKQFTIPTTKNVKINNYLCKIEESKDGKKICINIYQRGKRVKYNCFNDLNYSSIVMSPPAGTDLNGDGIPDIIFELFGQGAHCCSQYVILSLGKHCNVLDVLEGEHGSLKFNDLDGDGKYEAIGHDWVFAYWFTSFAHSPAPQIILRWENGKYHFAEDLMKKNYDREEILMTAKYFKDQQYVLPYTEKDRSLHIQEEIWAAMIELIYTGNGNLIDEFLDHAWIESENKSENQRWQVEKSLFLSGFKTQLKKSYYWADIKNLNKW
jgi:hypothetical protein